MQPLGTVPPHVEAHGLLSYPVECFWYWFPLGVIFHGVFFLAGVIAIGTVSIFRRGHFREWFIRWSLFSVSFFVVAGLLNGVWSCVIFGRLYWSADYVSDFSPFRPITQGVLDARFGEEVGGLLGVSLHQLQAIWLLFAITAWSSGFALYRLIRRRHGFPLVTQGV
jgi:hypothetical protein